MYLIFVYLILLFIRPQDWYGSPLYDLPVMYVLLPLGLMYGTFRRVEKNKDSYFDSITVYLLFFFVFWSFCSNIANGYSPDAFSVMVALFKRFVLFFVILWIVDSPKRMYQFLFFSLLLTIILVFQGIHQADTGVGWADQGLHGASSQIQQSSIYEYEEYGSRIFWIGDWDGPNVLALVFLFAIPFCLENIFKVSNRKFKRLLYLTTLILLTLGLKLTNSRGGYIAFICILAVFILMRFKIKYWPVVIVPLLLLIFIFSPKRMAIMDTGESSAHERTWLWEQGLNLGRENPVFGIGKGRFGQYAEKIAHSNYITNFAEIGYFGLFIFVALLYFSLKNAYLVYKLARKNDLELSSLSRIILITTIGFYIATFFVSMELDILYVILALCSGLTFFIKEQDRKFTRTISAVDIVSIIIINFVIILGYWLIAEKHII